VQPSVGLVLGGDHHRAAAHRSDRIQRLDSPRHRHRSGNGDGRIDLAVSADDSLDGLVLQVIASQFLRQRWTQSADESDAVERYRELPCEHVENFDHALTGIDQGHVEVEANGETHGLQSKGGRCRDSRTASP